MGRSVADRDYFQFHRSTEADVPFVSPVELGRATGKYLFRVTRRINDAQGRFAGVSLVTVDPESIAGFIAASCPGRQRGGADRSTRPAGPGSHPSPPENVWLRPLGSPLWHFARSPSAAIPRWALLTACCGTLSTAPSRVGDGLDHRGRRRAGEAAHRSPAPADRVGGHQLQPGAVCLAGVLTYIDRQRRQMNGLLRQQQAMLDNDLAGITVEPPQRGSGRTGRLPGCLACAWRTHRPIGPGSLPDDEAFRAVGLRPIPCSMQAAPTARRSSWCARMAAPSGVDMSGAMVSPETHESMWMMLDITDMKSRHAEVEQIAFQDTLTGPPNRSLLTDRLLQAMAMAAAHRHHAGGLLHRPGRFQAVNDRFGHAAGDRLLQVIGQRLQDCMRGAGDTVARLG